MPTSGHFIFIPAVLLIGACFGFIAGLRAAADRAAVNARKEEERKAARAARAARAAEKAAQADR